MLLYLIKQVAALDYFVFTIANYYLINELSNFSTSFIICLILIISNHFTIIFINIFYLILLIINSVNKKINNLLMNR